MYAAVHLNTKIQPALASDLRQRFNFSQRRVNESLTAKPGIHAHDKNMMNQRKNLVEGVDRCGWVYHYPWLTTVGSNELERAIEMDARFLMHRDPVDAGLGKRWDELVGAFDHEVAIERDLGDLAK